MLNSPSSLSLYSEERCHSPFIILVALCWTLSACLSCTVDPRPVPSPLGVFHQCCSLTCLDLLVMFLLNAAQNPIRLLCGKGTLLAQCSAW